MTKKLILLNGPAGVGKSTITELFLQENPLSIGVEGDSIIAMMGCWREYEDDARELVFQHTLHMANTQLKAGHDVVLPYLLVEPAHAEAFANVAQNNNAVFVEIVLYSERADAVTRLLERGVWGEKGSPKLTEEDKPEIEALYEKMELALQSRPDTRYIHVKKGDIQGTYRAFNEIVASY